MNEIYILRQYVPSKVLQRCICTYLSTHRYEVNSRRLSSIPGTKTRVATKVGFHNFAKYEISRNRLLISRNFAKFHEIYRYEFREISARNLISPNSAKSSHYRFSRNLQVRISRNFGKEFNFAKFCQIFPPPFFAKFIGTNFEKFRQGI